MEEIIKDKIEEEGGIKERGGAGNEYNQEREETQGMN